MLDLSAHETLLLGGDFVPDNDEIYIYLVTDPVRLPTYRVYIEDHIEEFSRSFKVPFDVLFAFDDPGIWWAGIIFEWKQEWYEEVQKPYEDWENEGGPCVEGITSRTWKRHI